MTYAVKLSEQELRTIAAALQELPYKFAQPVLASLQAQVDEQEKAALKEAGEPGAAP